MPQTRFWTLLAKQLTGEASEEEKYELEQALDQNPEWIYTVEQVQKLYNNEHIPLFKEDSEKAFHAHLNYLRSRGIQLPVHTDENLHTKPPKKRKLFSLKNQKVFFLLMTLIVTSGLIWLTPKNHSRLIASPQSNEISTKQGSRTKLVLADSSIVWLNAGSKLTYNNEFGHKNRNVFLSGEAYFNVRKNSIPFIIQTQALQIKVVGTVFNVKSYPNDKTTETSLMRGQVEITIAKRPGEKFILKPNEKLVVSNEPELSKETEIQKKQNLVILSQIAPVARNGVPEISWVEDKLVFKDETFEEVARKMERWYDVEIHFKNQLLKAVHLTGSFKKETLEQALSALQYTVKFNYRVTNNYVLLF
jgi:ferric-dicitrate binding protein FerR (iron transport regulator)